MIKLIAFDKGWVLFRPGNWEILHQKGFTDEEGYWLLREALGRTNDWICLQLKKGKSSKQIISVLKKYYPSHCALLDRVQPILKKTISIAFIDNIKLARKLQKRGYQVEIWSDNGLGGLKKNVDYKDSDIGLVPELKENCPIYKKYSSVHMNLKVPTFYSKDLGFKKENPEFFKKVLLAHPKIKPSEMMFIEDRPQNILSAKSLGINCIQFVVSELKGYREQIKGVPVIHTTKALIQKLHQKEAK